MTGHVHFWLGLYLTCCVCGESWGDGEMLPRPFRPRWRQEAAASAQAAWRHCVRLGGPEVRAWLKEELEAHEGAKAEWAAAEVRGAAHNVG